MAIEKYELFCSGNKTDIVNTQVIDAPALTFGAIYINDADAKRSAEVVAGLNQLRDYIVENYIGSDGAPAAKSYAYLVLGDGKGQIQEELVDIANIPTGTLIAGVNFGLAGVVLGSSCVTRTLNYMRDYAMENLLKQV